MALAFLITLTLLEAVVIAALVIRLNRRRVVEEVNPWEQGP